MIFALARTGRAGLSAAAVGAYIGAAYWFTSSTSFANPAVTVGRDVLRHLRGHRTHLRGAVHRRPNRRGMVGLALIVYLYPDVARAADQAVIPHPARSPNDTTHGADMTKPAVLFLCTHNAGRSQMAMGFFKHLAGDRATVYSGGSEPAGEVNPAAVAAMAEKGIDIATEQPKRWTPDMLEAVDVVVTMGCGDSCPVLPGLRYDEWVLPDPAGQPLDEVRPIRDEIEQRVREAAG